MIYQKHFHLCRCGFSMVEVMVSSVVFAMAAAGVFATIAYVNRPVVVDSKLEAALFAKRVLDNLDTQIYPGSAAFVDGTHSVPCTGTDLLSCVVVYTVSTEASGAKKVLVNVNWTPPNP